MRPDAREELPHRRRPVRRPLRAVCRLLPQLEGMKGQKRRKLVLLQPSPWWSPRSPGKDL